MFTFINYYSLKIPFLNKTSSLYVHQSSYYKITTYQNIIHLLRETSLWLINLVQTMCIYSLLKLGDQSIIVNTTLPALCSQQTSNNYRWLTCSHPTSKEDPMAPQNLKKNTWTQFFEQVSPTAPGQEKVWQAMPENSMLLALQNHMCCLSPIVKA